MENPHLGIVLAAPFELLLCAKGEGKPTPADRVGCLVVGTGWDGVESAPGYYCEAGYKG